MRDIADVAMIRGFPGVLLAADSDGAQSAANWPASEAASPSQDLDRCPTAFFPRSMDARAI
jgi:hypothetical protein